MKHDDLAAKFHRGKPMPGRRPNGYVKPKRSFRCISCGAKSRSETLPCARCRGRKDDSLEWNTIHELNWLAATLALMLTGDAVRFLKNYRQGAQYRTEWGGINKERVMEYIERQLALRMVA